VQQRGRGGGEGAMRSGHGRAARRRGRARRERARCARARRVLVGGRTPSLEVQAGDRVGL
jgi:hypothetical protein